MLAQMITGFVFLGLVAMVAVFLLSVVAPENSQHGFWGLIKSLRRALDSACYWFYSLCGIAVIVYVLYFILHGVLIC